MNPVGETIAIAQRRRPHPVNSGPLPGGDEMWRTFWRDLDGGGKFKILRCTSRREMHMSDITGDCAQ